MGYINHTLLHNIKSHVILQNTGLAETSFTLMLTAVLNYHCDFESNSNNNNAAHRIGISEKKISKKNKSKSVYALDIHYRKQHLLTQK